LRRDWFKKNGGKEQMIKEGWQEGRKIDRKKQNEEGKHNKKETKVKHFSDILL
jgi:hypothetical protein